MYDMYPWHKADSAYYKSIYKSWSLLKYSRYEKAELLRTFAHCLTETCIDKLRHRPHNMSLKPG